MELVVKVLLLVIPLICEARVVTSPRKARLTLAEPSPSYFFTNINGYPGTYAFGYDVQDGQTGNSQYRHEERFPNGTVKGSYGYVDAYGMPHRYRYVADEKGYSFEIVTKRCTNQRYYSFNSISDREFRIIKIELHLRVMNDLPYQPAVVYPIPQSPSTLEPSITWTRPKKKKEPSQNYLTKIPINKGSLLYHSNNLLPPSAYVSDY